MMNDSIFSPNYTITPRIQAQIDELERNHWLIENLLLMPQHEEWLHRDVRVSRAASHSSKSGANKKPTNLNCIGGLRGSRRCF